MPHAEPETPPVGGPVIRLRATRARLGPLLLAAIALFAGCAAGSDDEAATDAEESAPAQGGADEGFSEDSGRASETDASDDDAGGEPGGPADDPSPAPSGDQTERLLRREADLTVEVTDIRSAVDAAVRAAEDSGGYLGTQEISPEYSSMTLRVPSERFDAVLDELAALGTLRNQTITTDDRTDVIVDLEARLETAEASLERTRTFFDEAVNVEELTLLENELASREAEVASLQAQLDNERSGVSLSTIRITLSLDPGVEPAEVVPDDDPLPGVADSLSAGWDAIRTVGYVLVLAAAFLLPWLIPLALVVLGLRWLIRRNRSRAPKPMPLPPPPGSPAPRAPEPTAVPGPAAAAPIPRGGPTRDHESGRLPDPPTTGPVLGQPDPPTTGPIAGPETTADGPGAPGDGDGDGDRDGDGEHPA